MAFRATGTCGFCGAPAGVDDAVPGSGARCCQCGASAPGSGVSARPGSTVDPAPGIRVQDAESAAIGARDVRATGEAVAPARPKKSRRK